MQFDDHDVTEGQDETSSTTDSAATSESAATVEAVVDVEPTLKVVAAAEGEVLEGGEVLDAEEVEEAEVIVLDPREARIEELSAKLSDTQARLRAVSKAFTDQKAEMAQFRERVEGQAKARESLRGFEAVKAFFEPVQNLQRSIDVGAGDVEGLLSGIKMVHGQFLKGLTKLGLEPVPGIGARFDPNIHQALAMMPVSEPEQDGRVLMVHIDGYMVGGKAIQAGQVVVGSYTPPPVPEVVEPEAVEEATEEVPETPEA
jgi:molecular chaperone GrpE